jgi:hypothetical protein
MDELERNKGTCCTRPPRASPAPPVTARADSANLNAPIALDHTLTCRAPGPLSSWTAHRLSSDLA